MKFISAFDGIMVGMPSFSWKFKGTDISYSRLNSLTASRMSLNVTMAQNPSSSIATSYAVLTSLRTMLKRLELSRKQMSPSSIPLRLSMLSSYSYREVILSLSLLWSSLSSPRSLSLSLSRSRSRSRSLSLS